MVAKSSVYQAKSKKYDKGDGLGGVLAQREVFLAKFLKNTTPQLGNDWGDGYFNEADDAETKAYKIKNTLKIDGFIQVPNGDGGQSFIGYCHTRTGDNGIYHKTERFSGVFVPTTTNMTAELLNDAGLNRKPESYVGNTLNEPKWANWINLPAEIRSAFYNATTNYGYSYKINAGSWNDVNLNGTIGVKQIKEFLIRGINLTPTLSEGGTVSFRMLATNEEGTKYSTEYTFTALETIYSTGANKLETPDGSLGEGVYIYALSSTETDLLSVTDSDSATGIFLYNSEYFNSSNYLANGYYIIGGVPTLPNGNIKVFQVVSGEVRKYVERVPVTPILRLQLVNLGMDELPEYRTQATALDTEDGFTATLTLNLEINYYSYSGGIYTQVGGSTFKTLNITMGEFISLGGIVNLPPSGATHSKVITSTVVLGMTLDTPYVLL